MCMAEGWAVDCIPSMAVAPGVKDMFGVYLHCSESGDPSMRALSESPPASGLPLNNRGESGGTVDWAPVGLVLSAIAISALLALKTGAVALGPLSAHMSAHILLMNVLAPLLVSTFLAWRPQTTTHLFGSMLAAASLVQIVMLWGAHIPTVLVGVITVPAAHALVQGTLFTIALWFWWAVFAQPREQSWRSLFALLITGKLFCLLGVLLVFAPRPLFQALAMAHVGAGHASVGALEDQQLAGLLMLSACPLSYVLAGIVIAARWLRALADRETPVGI